MVINNPTNDQIVDMIQENIEWAMATRIKYKSFEIWIYTDNSIEYEDAHKVIKIDINRLIEIMSENQAELV